MVADIQSPDEQPNYSKKDVRKATESLKRTSAPLAAASAGADAMTKGSVAGGKPVADMMPHSPGEAASLAKSGVKMAKQAPKAMEGPVGAVSVARSMHKDVKKQAAKQLPGDPAAQKRAVRNAEAEVAGKVAGKAAGKVAQAALTETGVGAVAAPVAGKVVEKVVGAEATFFMKHKGLAITFFAVGLIPLLGVMMQIGLGMVFAMMYMMEE